MTGKMSKKGRNPGVVDNWLDSLDLYRKNVAYDETCLFRAVSEQIFDCQLFHERVRKECIEYGQSHYDQFKGLLANEGDWKIHLNLLEKHMVICGNLEINMISRKYERDVLIFHANQQQVYDVTKLGLTTKPIMLCLLDDDHYDAVYSKEHIANAGFCQSIVYKMLYEDVFKIPKVDDIVNAMLYEKTPIISELELEGKKTLADGQRSNPEDFVDAVIAPFPFKVAKALDPAIYRNIEYDSWSEVRRELRLGDWYYGDDKLKLGTRCVLNDQANGEMYDCYIQELLKNQDKCVVYLTKFAEKKTVKYADLAPESDAKPWPLPYRFSKNLVIKNTTTLLPPIEKIKCMRKKIKERRQSKSVSDVANVGTQAVDNVSAYVGMPLQMNNNNNTSRKIEVSTDTTDLGPPTPDTPDINNYPQRYQWEQVHWPTPVHYVPESAYYPHSAEPFVWPQGPPTPYYYDCKHTVASAPTTPNVVPYHGDTSYPFYFNYNVDPYPQYPLTPTTPTWVASQTPHNTPERYSETPPPQLMVRCPQSPTDGSAMVQNNAGQTVDQNFQHLSRQTVSYVPQTPPPHMGMYPPVLPLPPGTPVIYTTLPADLEMVAPTSTVTMYTPTTPADVQLVPPPGYMYSSGQSVSTVPWFQHGYPHNSQGFIFPEPIQQQQGK